jgi:hypothetical protein
MELRNQMARGWESKSVEEQIEAAQSRTLKPAGDQPSAAQINVMRERENILLSRTRVMRELQATKNPRYVTLLNRELKSLEENLQRLI